jgi:cyanophycinase-like exopeptidase
LGRFGGVGIDENTALVVELKRSSASLVGSGGASFVARSGQLAFRKAGESVAICLIKGQ